MSGSFVSNSASAPTLFADRGSAERAIELHRRINPGYSYNILTRTNVRVQVLDARGEPVEWL